MFTRKTTAWLFAMAIAACAPMTAAAQTISQPDASTNVVGPGQGQSFTATLTGMVTQIQVRPRANGSTMLRLYNGVGSGVLGSVGTPAYSQSVTLVGLPSDAPSEGFQTILLATPFPVSAGNQYTFVMDQASLSVALDGPYADGIAVSVYSETSDPLNDLAFTVSEVAPVPTMSEWAMILLGTALAGGAALYLHRRRLTVRVSAS